jgi:hypothetical protein
VRWRAAGQGRAGGWATAQTLLQHRNVQYSTPDCGSSSEERSCFECGPRAMDPSSQSFTPYSSSNDTWRLQTDVAKVQQVQAEHAERIARLERRQEDDARMKSVWGSNSPFPSVLSGGTPQQGGYTSGPRHIMTDVYVDLEQHLSNSHPQINSAILTARRTTS